MRFWDYLRYRRRMLLAAAVCCVIFAASFALYRLPLRAVLYPVGLCLLVGLGFAVWDYRRTLKRHRALTGCGDLTAELLRELPPPESLAEEDYRAQLLHLRQLCTELQSAADNRYRDAIEYYTTWAHQIKTPIASMRLALQGEDTALFRRLLSDLSRTEQYVEMVMAFLRLEDGALRAIISDYTSEAGVRTLERTIGAVCRKGAIAKMDGKKSFRVNEKKVHELLGPVQAMHDKIEDKSLVGCVTGLAWTAVGGEILTIEATAMKGSGQLQLTGKLGDVMQESAKAALSWARAHSEPWGLEADYFKKHDIHIHVPEGAVPKDGPSAGVTMATAIVSALTGIPVRRDVAMTGEITLRGRVLPIGGLREKTMAAKRSGIRTVIIPRENEKDLADIDPAVREALRFITAETVDAVFAHALTLPKKEAAVEHLAVMGSPAMQEVRHGDQL